MLPEGLTATLAVALFLLPLRIEGIKAQRSWELAQVSEPEFTPGPFNSSVCDFSNYTGIERISPSTPEVAHNGTFCYCRKLGRPVTV